MFAKSWLLFPAESSRTKLQCSLTQGPTPIPRTDTSDLVARTVAPKQPEMPRSPTAVCFKNNGPRTNTSPGPKNFGPRESLCTICLLAGALMAYLRTQNVRSFKEHHKTTMKQWMTKGWTTFRFNGLHFARGILNAEIFRCKTRPWAGNWRGYFNSHALAQNSNVSRIRSYMNNAPCQRFLACMALSWSAARPTIK